MIVFSYPEFVYFRVAKTTCKTSKRGEISWICKEKQPGLSARGNSEGTKVKLTEGPQRRDSD